MTAPAVGGSPPADVPAEQVVVGALLSGAALGDLGGLGEADFWRPAHAQIFAAIRDLAAAGGPVEAVAVLDRLRRRGQVRTPGLDGSYLHDCLAACPGRAFAGHYAAIVAEMAARRRLVELAAQLDQAARHPGEPGDLADVADQIVAEIDATLDRLDPDGGGT